MELYLWLAGIYVASVATSYIVGRLGVSTLVADVKALKTQATAVVSSTPVAPVTN